MMHNTCAMPNVFHIRLKAELDKRRWSISDLSMESRVKEQTIYAWFRREGLPSGDHLVAIAKAIGRSTDYLLGLADE